VTDDDRRDRRTVRTPPRGVGLTRTPVIRAATAPYGSSVPEAIDFDSKTPVGAEPDYWRAMRKFQSDNNEANASIKRMQDVLSQRLAELAPRVEILVGEKNKRDKEEEETTKFRRTLMIAVVTASGSGAGLWELVKWLVHAH
jgi:hypothetical protein